MKKILLAVMALFMLTLPSFAEISTGEPNSSVIPRTGNRPEQGDWGVYIGGSVTQIMDLVEAISDDSYFAWGLPLINLKYYVTDPLELRLGLQFAAKSTNDKATFNAEGMSGTAKAFESQHYTRLTPGVAYHFSNKNILDVYAGAQLPIGWEVNKTSSKASVAGISASERVYSGTFVIGAGLFLGTQVFIADLPFAIGVEGGFTGLIKAGGVPKTTVIDGNTKQVYYNNNPAITKASKVNASWGLDAALTFSYFFH